MPCALLPNAQRQPLLDTHFVRRLLALMQLVDLQLPAFAPRPLNVRRAVLLVSVEVTHSPPSANWVSYSTRCWANCCSLVRAHRARRLAPRRQAAYRVTTTRQIRL